MPALCGRGLALAPFASLIACGRTAPAVVQNPRGAPFQGTDKQLLDEIQNVSFQFSEGRWASVTRAAMQRTAILERVRVTLRFPANQMPTVHGFY